MPPADYWDQEDEWYSDKYRSGARYVKPHQRPRMDDYARRSDRDFLMPDHQYSSGLHRTRSVGHAPAPNVTIYNTTSLDNESNPHLQAEQRSPAPSPRPSPRGRPLRVADEWGLENELAELRLEVARQKRSRSRSRPYRDASPGPEYDRWQLDRANERLKEEQDRTERGRREDLIKKQMELEYLKTRQERDKEAEYERLEMEKREELLKKRMELKYFKDRQEREEEEARIKAQEDRLKKEFQLRQDQEDRKRADEKREQERLKREWELQQKNEELKRKQQLEDTERERKRIIAENTLKIQLQEKEAKEERQRAIDAYNAKRAKEEKEAKEERDRVIADYERKKSEDEFKAKRQKEELIMQLKIEEEKKKEKEKAEYEAFLLKQKQKDEEAKAKKKHEEEVLEEQMRKRLAQFGFQDNQIQAMIKPEKAKELQQGLAPYNPVHLGHTPTYVKVHKDHLSVDTLLYYDIPYEVDRADPNYIIVLREMDNRETEILFEHTKRLRSRGTGGLLIEERDRRGEKEYAWVRRRKHTPSPSRRRSSPKRVGVSELFRR